MRPNKQIKAIAAGGWRLLSFLMVVVAASATTVLAVAYGAGSGSGAPGTAEFAILSQSSPPTALSAVGGMLPPQGAVLAAQAGNSSVYVSQPSSSEVCVVTLETAGIGGAGCAHTQQADEQGVLLTVRPASQETAGATVTTAVLVPDGVNVVGFTDANGSARSVAVGNNVATLTDATVSSVDFTLPDGRHDVQPVPAAPVGETGTGLSGSH